ncbi:MAG: TGS domain-containing protein, partial [Halobacteriaceae archaeon]
KTGEGIEALKQAIWEKLSLIRIYMDKPGRGVDYEEPLIVEEGATVGDACKKLGGKFTDRFRFARVTGPSADHDNQQVGKEHTLRDEDI